MLQPIQWAKPSELVGLNNEHLADGRVADPFGFKRVAVLRTPNLLINSFATRGVNNSHTHSLFEKLSYWEKRCSRRDSELPATELSSQIKNK